MNEKYVWPFFKIGTETPPHSFDFHAHLRGSVVELPLFFAIPLSSEIKMHFRNSDVLTAPSYLTITPPRAVLLSSP